MEGFESHFMLEYVVDSVSQLSCFCYIWDIFDIVLTLKTVNLFKLGFTYSLWFGDLSQVPVQTLTAQPLNMGNAHFSVHTFLTRITSYNSMHKVVYSLSMAFDSLVLGTAIVLPLHIQLNHWARPKDRVTLRITLTSRKAIQQFNVAHLLQQTSVK